MSASEFAFLSLGLVLGGLSGAALVEILRSRPIAQREVRVTVAPDSVARRRAVTLSEDAFSGPPTAVAAGGPADQGEVTAAGARAQADSNDRSPLPPVGAGDPGSSGHGTAGVRQGVVSGAGASQRSQRTAQPAPAGEAATGRVRGQAATRRAAGVVASGPASEQAVAGSAGGEAAGGGVSSGSTAPRRRGGRGAAATAPPTRTRSVDSTGRPVMAVDVPSGMDEMLASLRRASARAGASGEAAESGGRRRSSAAGEPGSASAPRRRVSAGAARAAEGPA